DPYLGWDAEERQSGLILFRPFPYRDGVTGAREGRSRKRGKAPRGSRVPEHAGFQRDIIANPEDAPRLIPAESQRQEESQAGGGGLATLPRALCQVVGSWRSGVCVTSPLSTRHLCPPRHRILFPTRNPAQGAPRRNKPTFLQRREQRWNRVKFRVDS